MRLDVFGKMGWLGHFHNFVLKFKGGLLFVVFNWEGWAIIYLC